MRKTIFLHFFPKYVKLFMQGKVTKNRFIFLPRREFYEFTHSAYNVHTEIENSNVHTNQLYKTQSVSAKAAF